MARRQRILRRPRLLVPAACGFLLWSFGCAGESKWTEPEALALLSSRKPEPFYDADPGHLWNRLHAALNCWRTSGEVPPDFSSDWLHSPAEDRYLTGEYQEAAAFLLDEFLASEGSAGIVDPLRRALLQHNLWLVFD